MDLQTSIVDVNSATRVEVTCNVSGNLGREYMVQNAFMIGKEFGIWCIENNIKSAVGFKFLRKSGEYKMTVWFTDTAEALLFKLAWS